MPRSAGNPSAPRIVRSAANRGRGTSPHSLVNIPELSGPETLITAIAARKLPVATAKIVDPVIAAASVQSRCRQHVRNGTAALNKMALQNRIDIRGAADVIPDAFRIDHDTWSMFATVQASGGVNPYPRQAELLGARLHVIAQLLRTALGAAALGVTIGAPVRADENMEVEKQLWITFLAVAHLQPLQNRKTLGETAVPTQTPRL
jgi:hypothetical protein